MPRYKLPDGTIYNIPEEKVNSFLQKYPDAVTETLGKITPLQEDQTGVLAEVNTSPAMDLSLGIPSLDSQEKDTAIERTFGKNSLTDFFGDIYRAANKGLEQSSLVDPSINLYREGAEADDETILNFIKANEETNKNIMQSDEMREFNNIYEESGGGWWGFVKGAALNPTVLTQELVSSIAMQIGALKSDEVATAATGGLVAGATGAGLATAGALAVPGGIAGAMGGAMAALETGLTFSELLNKELGDNLTVENVRAFLQNEEKLSDLKNKALGRGLTIGAIELATMGIAKGVGGKIAKAGFKRAGLAAAGAIGGIEIAGGATGEIAGRFVAGQEMDAAEIGFEAFAGLGSAPVSILGQSKNISKGISRIKIDKELANTKYKNISDLFLNEEKTSEAAINLTKIKNSVDIIIEEINNKVKKGEITKEQSDKIKENFAITEQANNKLDVLEYQEKNKSEIIDLLKEKSNLEIKIKKVNEASLTKPESDRIQEIVARLNEVAEINTAKKLKKSVSFAKKAGRALGLETEVLSQEEIRKQYGNEAADSDGFIKNGKIIINEEVARQTEAVTVGSHEVLHGILNKALKGKDANKIVNQFKKVIGKQQLAKIEERLYGNDENGKRLYSDEYIAANQDEYFTLFSDAIIKNQIEYNENIFTKLGDLIRPILRKLGFSKIKFESGRDVYNFLKEYNKSVKEGALSQDIINLGAEISSEKIQLSKTASEKVQKIFDEKGKDGAFDIIEAYKPLTTKLTNKYRDVPGFDFELLQSEIEIGKRGLLDLINAYNPSKGATLNTYIQGQLANRSIEAANRILDTEFKLDVTEAKGVTDTVTAEETIEREEAAPADEIKSLRKEIGLSEELVTKVKDAVVKTFGTKLPNPQNPKFRFELQKRFRTELKKPLSKFVGKQADYEAFLRDNFESVYSKMPQSLINRRFKEFAEPVLDKNGKQLRERTAEGNKVYVKKKISKAEWVKYFIGADVKSSTKGARKTAIVEGIAEEIAFDATMEVLNDPDVISKYQDIAGITGEVLPENFKSLIAKQVDRAEGFKFSKSIVSNTKFSKSPSGNLNVYHGGTLKNIKKAIPPIYFSPNEQESIVYAKGRPENELNQSIDEGGTAVLINAEINEKNVVDESVIFNEIKKLKLKSKEQGENIDDLNLYELIDTSFPTSLNTKDLNKLFESLKNKKIKAAKFIDEGISVDRTLVQNIVVFDTSVIENPKYQTKFSKSLTNIAKAEYNLESQELAKILDKTSLDKLSNKYSLISDAIIYEADPTNIKFSLTTKAEGKWEQEPLNPLDESSKLYKFKVGEIDYEIRTFKNVPAPDYSVFKQTEGIALREAIDNDPKSWSMTFADADTGSTDVTGVAAKGLTNQFKVFGTVANSAIDLIKNEKLNSITFTAKEKSRKRLYRSLNEKFANELEWETYDYEIRTPDGEETVFVAYDPKAFSVEEVVNPPQIKFSNSNSKFNVTAKKLLTPEGWAKWSNAKLEGSKILQDEIGDIRTQLGSQRPSYVVSENELKGFDKLKPKEKKILRKKIKDLRKSIISYKAKTNFNILKPGESFGNPAEKFGRNAAEIKNNIENGNIFKLQNTYSRVYDSMWEKYYNILEKNPDMFDFLESTLQTSSNDVSHWHRLGAIFLGYDPTALKTFAVDKDGNKKFKTIYAKDGKEIKIPITRTFEYEHAVQNHIQWKRVLNAAKRFAKNKNKKGFLDYLKKSKEDYVLIAISVADSKKINEAGYAHVMPKNWKKWVDRYIASNIDLNKIVNISYSNNNAFIEKNINSIFVQKFSKSLNKEFNKILEQSTGVDWAKRFSPVEARVVGKGKGKKFFIPYSADDFVGLLYATLGTKKQGGNEQMEWYKENLLRPFSRGIQQYEAAKQQALRDWQVLKKEAKKDVPGGLGKKNATGLTNQDAVRIYIWATQGMDIPGTEGSPELVQQNLEAVKADEKLKAFADRLMALNPEGYPEPSNNWDSGDITTDIVSYINGVKRSEFLTEWKENADEIFSDQNKEKLRALYGDTYVEALNDILYRMRTGTNRKFGASKIEKQFMDWTNNSVGAIMFFNARSAVLQTLSAVNFINFSDNNPISAALAFANFPQYVKDFTTLFNSDFLKQRRTGLQTDVNADEIARAAKGSKNTARAMLSALLKFGFTPTQIADSFAIASGGATFYRNRINKYLKEGLSQKEAESKAFTDFQEIAEETQQSARPDRISSQQASSLGRLILAFGNTPMQYARLTKKATLDLINGRGDWKTNISKIAYYSVIQNIIFSALQQGLFALLFDDEDDDKEKSRLFRIGNSSFDTLLRGIGVYGAAAATVKNMIIEIIEQSEKSRPDYTKIAIEATSLSPPINSKLRKLESAGKTFTYKQSKEKVFTEGFSLENPAFLAGGKVLSAATNLPADRIVQKADHLYTAMQSETELWQAIALSLGWSEWDLNMIEKQTKKSKKFNPRDTNRNINRTVKRKFKR
jgi:hypothetical protein